MIDAPVWARSWKILEPSELAKYFSIFVDNIWPLLATTPSAFIALVASFRTSYFVSVETVMGSFFLGDSHVSTWVGSLASVSLDPIFAAPRASERAFLVVSGCFPVQSHLCWRIPSQHSGRGLLF